MRGSVCSAVPDPALQQSRGVRALGGPQKIPRISDRFLRAQSCRVRAFGGPQDLCARFQRVAGVALPEGEESGGSPTALSEQRVGEPTRLGRP